MQCEVWRTLRVERGAAGSSGAAQLQAPEQRAPPPCRAAARRSSTRTACGPSPGRASRAAAVPAAPAGGAGGQRRGPCCGERRAAARANRCSLALCAAAGCGRGSAGRRGSVSMACSFWKAGARPGAAGGSRCDRLLLVISRVAQVGGSSLMRELRPSLKFTIDKHGARRPLREEQARRHSKDDLALINCPPAALHHVS